MWADTFHLHIGDTLGFLVGERAIDARLTSIREVDWSSFNVNFFVMLDPVHGRRIAARLDRELSFVARQRQRAGRVLA